eukprot:scaffold54450_cov63-Phaeocystis_antarctica.AAC.3
MDAARSMVPATGKLTVYSATGTCVLPHSSAGFMTLASFLYRLHPPACVHIRHMHPSACVHARPRSSNKKSTPKCGDSGLSQLVVQVQSVPSSRQTPDGPQPPSWQIASAAVTQVSRHFEGRGEVRGGGSGTLAAFAFASAAAKVVPATTSVQANEEVHLHARHARSSEHAGMLSNQFRRVPKGDSQRRTRVGRAGLRLGLAL